MKIIQIENPCEEKWDNMQIIPDGKFCDLCDKKVWDLDKVSESEFHEVIKNNDSICGKKSFIKPAFSSLILALTLTSVTNIQAQTENKSSVENVHQNEIEIKGKLTSIEKRKLISGEISLITLEKIYSAKAQENGNFSLRIPEKILTEYNIIRIDYTILDDNDRELTDHKSSVLKRSELLAQENFEIEKRFVTIGAVVITNPKPHDFYFFDGKKLERENLKK